MESVAGADLVILVADPTPFGLNDLKLSVDMCRKIDLEPVVIVNRAEYKDDSLKEYCRDEDLKIIGEIPDDREIAETYSRGEIVVDRMEEYRDLFKELAERIEREGEKEREVKRTRETKKEGEKIRSSELSQSRSSKSSKKRKELVIISGKGGTGKTSLMASFVALADEPVLSDCDVDAADLHLLTDPEVKEKGLFTGGFEALIDQEKCTSCGKCEEECRFDAIYSEKEDGKLTYKIDSLECEGCGVCEIVCPEDAVELEEVINGEWYISETRLGDMSHAKLGMAEENTGRLVTLVRDNADKLGTERSETTVIDGAPGTGCPVIASITGSDYALVVTEPSVSGIHDMKRVLDVANHFGIESGIVINKADLNEEMTDCIMKIAEERGSEVLGKIPYDDRFTEAQMRGLTAVEYLKKEDQTYQTIEEIWEKVYGKMHGYIS